MTASGSGGARVLLITPPLLQPNAPYAALPAIAGFLKSRDVDVVQADLSLALVLELFSAEGMETLIAAARHRRDSPAARFLLENVAEYRAWIGPAVAFLQGRAPEYAWRFAAGALPEGPHFRELDEDGEPQGGVLAGQGVFDRARLCASLFLDDVADLFRELLDPDFGFSRYAERLAVSAPTFDPLWRRLRSRRPTDIDRRIDRLAEEAVRRHHPTHVGVTVPFPGTVYGAFRVAQAVRRADPAVRLVLGGGYVNSELREMTDERVFAFFDDVCFDEGFGPWLGIVGLGPRVRTMGVADVRPARRSGPTGATMEASAQRQQAYDSKCADRQQAYNSKDAQRQQAYDRKNAERQGAYRVVVSDYAGLDLGAYIPMAESANPMHRLWSDGRWLKVQLANGCYWHRCAFCDVSLDYIGCYRMPDPAQAVDALLEMKRATGLCGFHFTDEALSPALARGVSEELLRRGERIAWWGNVRLDRGFDAELASLMARAGCIAITAGLECANDRLLRLMRKGVTLASARRACRAFAESGILVHVYLMYGFPTETEEETLGALEAVRDLFAEGVVQSAFWHRFALTVHSPIARDPAAFGIELVEEPPTGKRRFARNEIAYREPGAPDLDRLGQGLRLATYNFMRGQGLDWPVGEWFR